MRNIKHKFLPQVAAISTASLILAGSAWQDAQAQQRTTSLFSANCIYSNHNLFRTGEMSDVVINREVFTSIASAASGTSATCRIRPAGATPSFGTLRLAFGISDSNYSGRGGSATLNVYLDGTLVASRTISGGQRALLVIDVSRASSVAIESAAGSNRETVLFTQALLEPLSLSPGQRQ